MISKAISKGQGIEAVETISEEEMERRLAQLAQVEVKLPSQFVAAVDMDQ